MIGLLIGLIVGYYARQLYDKVSAIYHAQVESYEARKAGVVKPSVSRITKGQQTSGQTGGVMRPTPDQVLFEKFKADRNPKDMSI